MNELYRYRSFSNSRGYALYRTMAYVADGKNAWNIGLEQEGIPIESPSFRTLAIADEIGTGEDESAFVALDQARQPIGSGQSSDEDEHGTRGHALDFVGVGTQD